MKKMAVLMIGAVMSLVGSAYSADNASVDVILSVQDLSVTLVGVDGNGAATSMNVNTTLGTSKVSPRAQFKNTGNFNENFNVRVANVGSNWALVSGVPGANEYRLSSIWHQWDVAPSTGEFQTNDVLTTSNQLSSDTVFFNDTETHENTPGVKGYNVPVNFEQNLYLKFDAPASATAPTNTATVTVTATSI